MTQLGKPPLQLLEEVQDGIPASRQIHLGLQRHIRIKIVAVQTVGTHESMSLG
jgi:hypothetical protein